MTKNCTWLHREKSFFDHFVRDIFVGFDSDDPQHEEK